MCCAVMFEDVIVCFMLFRSSVLGCCFVTVCMNCVGGCVCVGHDASLCVLM